MSAQSALREVGTDRRRAAHSINKKFSVNAQALMEGYQMDLWRGIRHQLGSLLEGLDPKDLATMSLGLSHSLSRYARVNEAG